jgi:hypothetical protein
VVRRHDPAFVRRLAEAMRSACDRRRRVALPPRVRSAIDQRRAYQSYAELYAWLVQGGGPEVARRCSAARPAPSASQAPAVGEGIRAA